MLSAQDEKDLMNTRPKNNINLNLFGDLTTYSINYERQFFLSPEFALSGKVGFGYVEESKN